MPTKLRFHIARATFVSLAVILGLAVAGVMALNAGRALASHVSCGDTITTDTTLDSDLANCPNNGIVIGADHITVDLNGHRVDGDGTLFAGCPEDEPCDLGVLNDGHDGVTVRDGSVRQFAVGAYVFSARHNRVLGISSSKNLLFGFVVANSARSLVRRSSGSRNLAPDGDGMGLFGSHHIRIRGSSFRRNHGPGIHVFDSTDTLIKGNRLSRNEVAILMEADRNVVSRNQVSRGGDGIAIAGNRNIVRGNRVDSSRGFGIPLVHGNHNLCARNLVRDTQTAISVGFEPGAGNVVRRNHVRRAGEAGVLVDSRGKHTMLRRNVVRGAGEDGVKVDPKAKHTVLRRNRARHLKDDGFDVNSRTTKLTGNRAVRNGDLGVEAVRGVIDGGGNIARHNGDPRQCTHIACN